MPERKIVLFGDNTIDHHPKCLGRLLGHGSLKKYNWQLIQATGLATQPYKVGMLTGLLDEWCVSINPPQNEMSSVEEDRLELFDELGDYAQVLPNPKLVGIFCHLLRAQGWDVEFATTAYRNNPVPDDDKDKSFLHTLRFEAYKHFYQNVEFIDTRKRGKFSSKRDYLTLDFADAVHATYLEFLKEGIPFTINTIISEVIKQKFKAQGVVLTDREVVDTKIIFVSSHREEGEQFKQLRKVLGAKPEDSVVIYIDPVKMMDDPYRHFYYVLQEIYNQSGAGTAKATMAAELGNQCVKLKKGYSEEQIETFMQRVIGSRLMDSQDCIGPKIKKLVYCAVASPNPLNRSYALGFRNKVYLQKFTGTPGCYEVALQGGGKPYAMAYTPCGNGLWVAGKHIWFISLSGAWKSAKKIPVTLRENERVVNIAIDKFDELHLLINQRAPRLDQPGQYLQHLRLPFPYASQRDPIQNRVVMPLSLGEELISKRTGIAAYRSVFGAHFTSIYSLSVTPDVKSEAMTGAVVSAANQDIMSHELNLETKDVAWEKKREFEKEYLELCKILTDQHLAKNFSDEDIAASVITRPKFLRITGSDFTSGRELNIKYQQPYLVNVTPFRSEVRGRLHEGFMVAYVNSDHSIQLYKLYKVVLKIMSFTAVVHRREKANWHREKVLDYKGNKEPVTCIQFTPNCMKFLMHTMNGEHTLLGTLTSITVPGIAYPTEKVVTIPIKSQDIETTCGIPTHIITMKQADRVSVKAILVSENAERLVEIPII